MSNILVVDDSSIMRKSISAILKEAGHTVVAEAVNGFQACMEFDKYNPDLVTLDIDMPYMNGIDTLKAIIKRHPNANILMVAHADSSLICDALNAGAKGYVMKPFCIEELVNTVNSILESKSTLTGSCMERIYSIINSL